MARQRRWRPRSGSWWVARSAGCATRATGIALLVGQALLFGSLALLVYAAGIFLAFHLFVVFYEEPTLRRQFGAEYEAYCRAVPRWIPRLGQRPPQPGAEP
jgi:hypothetical protein